MLLRRALFGLMLMDQNNGNNQGGGGGNHSQNQNQNQQPDLAKENADLKAKLAEYEKQKSQSAPAPVPPKDETLVDKQKQAEDERTKTAALETALTFNIKASTFFKENESLLPKEVAEMLAIAEKEKYDSPVQKANSIKSAVAQSFFKVQENLDLLTPSHKNLFDDFLKLTKNGKEEKAPFIYENLFEPALEALRRQRKADEVNRAQNGYGNPTDAQKAYEEKMKAKSKQHFFKEKK